MPAPTRIQFEERSIDQRTAKQLASAAAIGGTPVAEWWKRQSALTQQKFMDAVRTSMRNGESSVQAATRIFGGTINGVKVPGVMQATRAQAAALVQTSMNHVTNQARLAAYQENTDVIKAIQQISTLDNKTTDICIAYSGDQWDVTTLEPIGDSHAFNGGCPRHFNCRSTIVPVTKSFEELGIDAKEVQGTRASMDGQVAGDITFDAWLKTKGAEFQNEVLGEAKAALWRANKISLSQLVDFTGNPLSVAQLEELAKVPKAAAVPKAAKVVAPGSEWDDLFKNPYKDTIDNDGDVEALSKALTGEYHVKHVPHYKDIVRRAHLDSIAALESYRGSGYSMINGALRGTENVTSKLGKKISMLRTLVSSSSELTENTAVWRGMHGMPDDVLKLKPGDVFQAQGMLSTSTNPYTALNWGADIGNETAMFEIVLPKGAKKVMRGFNIGEQEVLLDHDSKFQVLSVRTERAVNSVGNTFVRRVYRLLFLE